MKDESGKGIFKRLFFQKSACCSLDIEKVETTEQKPSDGGNDVSNCCCCAPSKPLAKKNKEMVAKKGPQKKDHIFDE